MTTVLLEAWPMRVRPFECGSDEDIEADLSAFASGACGPGRRSKKSPREPDIA